MYDASLEESTKYVPIRSKQVNTMKRLIPNISIPKTIVEGTKTFRSLEARENLKTYNNKGDTQMYAISQFVNQATSLTRDLFNNSSTLSNTK